MRLLRRRKHWTVTASDTLTVSDSATVSVWYDMSADAPDRLRGIAENVERLRQDVERLGGEHRQAVDKLRADVEATRRERRDHADELEAQRKAELRTSIKWEAWGVALFLAGTACSVAGSLAQLRVTPPNLSGRATRNASSTCTGSSMCSARTQMRYGTASPLSGIGT